MIPILVAIADLHRTSERPVCRVEEDIIETQNRKLYDITGFCWENNVPLLVAGDTCDNWKCGHEVPNWVKYYFAKVKQVIACFGQHELPNHDLKEKWRSPLTGILMGNTFANVCCGYFSSNGFKFYIDILNWGEKPKAIPSLFDKDVHRILLIHKTVYHTIKPYPDAKGNVEKLLDKTQYSQYDLIISGDNHRSFTYRKGKTLWLNCGCVFRTDASEIDYVPSYWVLYWSKKNYRFFFKQVPLVFNREDVSNKHLELKKKEQDWDSSFANDIQIKKGMKTSKFKENLERASHKDPKPVQTRIQQCVDDEPLPF